MTYLAQTKGCRIHFPPAIADFVRTEGWSNVKVAASEDNESLTVYPLPHPGAPSGGHSTVIEGDAIHISETLRAQVNLDGQNVMVRVEEDVVRIYLRRVFKTLGFRPD